MGEAEYETRGTTVTTGAGRTPALGADPRRVALIVSIAVSGLVIQLNAVGAPDVDHTINVPSTSPVYLTFKDHGPLLSYAWDIVDQMGATQVSIVEVLYNKRGG